MTCLGCRQLGGAESSPGGGRVLHHAAARWVPAALQRAPPRPGGERVTWSLGLQRVLFGSACQKSSPGMLVQLQGMMDGGKAGAEGRWRVQVK